MTTWRYAVLLVEMYCLPWPIIALAGIVFSLASGRIRKLRTVLVFIVLLAAMWWLTYVTRDAGPANPRPIYNTARFHIEGGVDLAQCR